MKGSLSLCSQKSKVVYNTDISIFCMSQLQLFLLRPSGSLEHFSLCVCVCVCTPGCRAEQDTTQTRCKTQRPDPWAASAYSSAVTDRHDKTLKNRNLQIRRAEVNSFRQFC